MHKVTEKSIKDSKIATEYINNHDLNVTDEVKKLVLDTADKDIIDSIKKSIKKSIDDSINDSIDDL